MKKGTIFGILSTAALFAASFFGNVQSAHANETLLNSDGSLAGVQVNRLTEMPDLDLSNSHFILFPAYKNVTEEGQVFYTKGNFSVSIAASGAHNHGTVHIHSNRKVLKTQKTVVGKFGHKAYCMKENGNANIYTTIALKDESAGEKVTLYGVSQYGSTRSPWKLFEFTFYEKVAGLVPDTYLVKMSTENSIGISGRPVGIQTPDAQKEDDKLETKDYTDGSLWFLEMNN